MRRTYDLRPETAHLLDALYITSGREKSEIVNRGIIYAYVIRKTLSPELVCLVEQMTDELMDVIP